ncbi:50S ribosomal protein L10 [Fodinicola acaciae]|uniref:50S ribosomal protein L10 n=1 Tax=Fodinicola acaciae TaxID=2681555 RepID=UPI001C9E4816|nr:50S ribosomal protein L10 [Fodinicola acaciae]
MKSEKVQAVAELAAKFRDSSASVLTEYRGLSVAQLTELRRALGRETTYTVAKNTLTQRAAKDAGLEGLDELFVGPTAIAFVGGDPVEAAKQIRDFSRANPLLIVKGGVIEGRAATAEDITKLANLESREVLLSKLAGAMKGSMAKAAATFAAPATQLARTLAALQEKKAAGAASTTDAAAEAGAEG